VSTRTPALVPENLESLVYDSSHWCLKCLLEEQSWKLFPLLFRATRPVDHVHLNFIHKLHRRNWDAGPHDLRCCRRRISYRWESNDRDTGLLGYYSKLECDLSNES
jgi:hypothetical protein